jgi:hypothetical protein
MNAMPAPAQDTGVTIALLQLYTAGLSAMKSAVRNASAGCRGHYLKPTTRLSLVQITANFIGIASYALFPTERRWMQRKKKIGQLRAITSAI